MRIPGIPLFELFVIAVFFIPLCLVLLNVILMAISALIGMLRSLWC